MNMVQIIRTEQREVFDKSLFGGRGGYLIERRVVRDDGTVGDWFVVGSRPVAAQPPVALTPPSQPSQPQTERVNIPPVSYRVSTPVKTESPTTAIPPQRLEPSAGIPSSPPEPSFGERVVRLEKGVFEPKGGENIIAELTAAPPAPLEGSSIPFSKARGKLITELSQEFQPKQEGIPSEKALEIEAKGFAVGLLSFPERTIEFAKSLVMRPVETVVSIPSAIAESLSVRGGIGILASDLVVGKAIGKGIGKGIERIRPPKVTYSVETGRAVAIEEVGKTDFFGITKVTAEIGKQRSETLIRLRQESTRPLGGTELVPVTERPLTFAPRGGISTQTGIAEITTVKPRSILGVEFPRVEQRILLTAGKTFEREGLPTESFQAGRTFRAKRGELIPEFDIGGRFFKRVAAEAPEKEIVASIGKVAIQKGERIRGFDVSSGLVDVRRVVNSLKSSVRGDILQGGTQLTKRSASRIEIEAINQMAQEIAKESGRSIISRPSSRAEIGLSIRGKSMQIAAKRRSFIETQTGLVNTSTRTLARGLAASVTLVSPKGRLRLSPISETRQISRGLQQTRQMGRQNLKEMQQIRQSLRQFQPSRVSLRISKPTRGGLSMSFGIRPPPSLFFRPSSFNRELRRTRESRSRKDTFRFRPSIIAREFGFRTARIPRETISGINIRPILRGERRMAKKRKK